MVAVSLALDGVESSAQIWLEEQTAIERVSATTIIGPPPYVF